MLSNTKRCIVKQISFTARCSGMADPYIYRLSTYRYQIQMDPPSIEHRCLVHIISVIRFFICNMKRPSVKQSIKQQVSSNVSDLPPHFQTVTTALHCIQLYILSSFICCHLVLSYWTGQSYIYYFIKFLSISSCCCCAFDCILLLLLCITQQQQAQLQQQPEKINIKVFAK